MSARESVVISVVTHRVTRDNRATRVSLRSRVNRIRQDTVTFNYIYHVESSALKKNNTPKGVALCTCIRTVPMVCHRRPLLPRIQGC